MARIGFIGLGHMGNPMVMNLLSAHEVAVFDISKSAIEAVQLQGAIACPDVATVVKSADVVFTMLQTGQQVRDVCLQSNGIFAGIPPESLYIDSSSIDIKSSRYIHDIARQKNIAMLDAPVSGGVAGAQKATLTFMVGGDEQNFHRAEPFLNLLGKRIIYAGKAGNGQAAKICNNMILGISMIGVAEAFLLGKKLGLDPKTFFDISSNSSGECWSMTHYCPMPGIIDNVPANNDYTPGFAAKMMLKDLQLSQEAAQQINASTPLGAEATSLYSLFVNNGFGELDFSGIIKMLAGKEE